MRRVRAGSSLCKSLFCYHQWVNMRGKIRTCYTLRRVACHMQVRGGGMGTYLSFL